MNSHFDIYALVTPKVTTVPYVSEGIPAGFPSPATDYIGDRIDLNEVLILNPGVTYYARVRDYYMVEEELEQGDGILFDTSLAPRSGDLALCEVCGERVLKYVRRKGRAVWVDGGGTDATVPLDGDADARVLGVVTVIIKIRRFKKRRTRIIRRLPQKELPMLFERRAIRAAWFPESNVPVEGLLDLNEELIPNPVSTFFGRVKGISLVDDDIEDSDSVIVDRMLEPQWGDLAVCVTQEGFTMKYVEVRDNGEVWLMPGNKDYAPMRITEDNERLLWGIVTHSIRQFRLKKGDKE
nr:S24 family peptidase [Alistipes onderdonkii]